MKERRNNAKSFLSVDKVEDEKRQVRDGMKVGRLKVLVPQCSNVGEAGTRGPERNSFWRVETN